MPRKPEISNKARGEGVWEQREVGGRFRSGAEAQRILLQLIGTAEAVPFQDGQERMVFPSLQHQETWDALVRDDGHNTNAALGYGT